ncbi:hypothetical protein Tco_0427599 [Tanacetum coccineum]
MMQSYCEIMSQRREQEPILLQEQAVEEKQELLAEELCYPSKLHLEELFPDEVKRIQQILERTSFDAITPDFPITDSLSMGDEHLSTILETELDELIKSGVTKPWSKPQGNGYSLKDKNKGKNDKTKHGNGKSMKDRS